MAHPSKIGHNRDGFFRKNIIKVSTASTAYDIQPDESGAVYWINTATTLNMRLPRISSKWLGLTYDLAIQEQATGNDVRLTCNTYDSSALIQTGYSSAVDNHTTAIPASTFFTGARITAVSSIVWMLEQITGIFGEYGTTDADSIGGSWTTG